MAELGKDELKIHCDLLNKLEGYEIFVTGKIFYECFKLKKEISYISLKMKMISQEKFSLLSLMRE